MTNYSQLYKLMNDMNTLRDKIKETFEEINNTKDPRKRGELIEILRKKTEKAEKLITKSEKLQTIR